MFLWRFYRWFAITACAYRVYKSRHFHLTNNTHFPYKKNDNLRNPRVMNVKLVKSANYLAIYEKGAWRRKDGGIPLLHRLFSFLLHSQRNPCRFFVRLSSTFVDDENASSYFPRAESGCINPRRRYVMLARITLISDKYKVKHVGCIRRYQLAQVSQSCYREND